VTVDLLPDVEAYIARYQLLEPGARVVVGVSGGPDSVALFDLLRRLALSWNFKLHVAHLHHGIRGADADADAAFVSTLAERWGVPCTVERLDLPEIAAQMQVALEEAARRVRYAFLARVAQQAGTDTIAVAHNADDQSETVLMHLLRGAGPAGLRGMLPATPLQDYGLLPLETEPAPEMRLVRPLLATPRSEIEAYCAAQGLETRLDRSNLDTTFFRNYLRHEVLPYLAKSNPQISERLRHLAEVVRADYALLEDLVDQAWETVLVEAYADAFVFDLACWRSQPLAVRRALIRRATYSLRHTLRDVDFVHVEQAAGVMQEGTTGAQATLPMGMVAEVGYTTLTIADAEALHLPQARPWLSAGAVIPLNIPGKTPLPGAWTLSVDAFEDWKLADIVKNPDPLTVWMDARALRGDVVLRTRRPGDRFQPQGLNGATVKLSDFLVNAKCPSAWRDALPLLEADGTLLWVAGMRLSEAALIQEDTRQVLRFKFSRVAAAQSVQEVQDAC